MTGIPARSGLMALLMVMLMALAGCSTTVEAQQNRFKKNTDTIEVLAAKNPMMQRAVKEKLAGFQAEHDSIVAKGGETAPKELARLNSRMEEYVKKMDPSLAPQKASTTGKKLGTTPTGAAPSGKLGGAKPGAPGAAPTGKLGGAKPGAPGAAPAGKLGGGTAAPGAIPGGKLGGGTAAPAGKLGGGTAAPAGKLGGGTAAPAGKLGGGAAAPAGKLGGGAPGTAPAGKLGGQ